jgi:coiled-coil domain-containing protein 12
MLENALRSWFVPLLLHLTARVDETRKQDLFNIAPKRANWDLKREMEKKLAKLDRKTQEAIHTLISTFVCCL